MIVSYLLVLKVIIIYFSTSSVVFLVKSTKFFKSFEYVYSSPNANVYELMFCHLAICRENSVGQEPLLALRGTNDVF